MGSRLREQNPNRIAVSRNLAFVQLTSIVAVICSGVCCASSLLNVAVLFGFFCDSRARGVAYRTLGPASYIHMLVHMLMRARVLSVSLVRVVKT